MVLAVNLHFTDRGSNPLLLKQKPFTRLDELKLNITPVLLKKLNQEYYIVITEKKINK